ncbi:2'-5'-oligoadenylate synthase 3-like [Monodon monoceros]|uniref:2'-5'-oligoadenylate synthase 3-like n=1 Tax=Monodon monoceros TaxID=40151 RepID=UPI0010F906D9|nr:2'-5'-oligoadenylate synthase 3-like [Monodon monoceros]
MLECKCSQELQRFADKKIRPASGSQSAACVAEISALLQLIQGCFPVPASRVIQGGSYVKGTDTQGCSEIDIVLLSDVFASVNHCKKQLREGLETLRENLKRTSHGNRLYLCNDRDEAQLCALALLPYQVDFVKASVVRVKGLSRLMIHWFKTSFANTTKEMELLTIYIWERAEKPLFFSLVQGMRAVLKLLVRYAEIDVVWHRHYHPKFPIFVKVNQKHTRPFILDPVNPTVNVCDTCNAWDEVAHVDLRSGLVAATFRSSSVPLSSDTNS